MNILLVSCIYLDRISLYICLCSIALLLYSTSLRGLILARVIVIKRINLRHKDVVVVKIDGRFMILRWKKGGTSPKKVGFVDKNNYDLIKKVVASIRCAASILNPGEQVHSCPVLLKAVPTGSLASQQASLPASTIAVDA